MILEQMYDQDDQLLNWGFLAFKKGYTDRVVLDYLCEHYNGTSRQMYQILAKPWGPEWKLMIWKNVFWRR